MISRCLSRLELGQHLLNVKTSPQILPQQLLVTLQAFGVKIHLSSAETCCLNPSMMGGGPGNVSAVVIKHDSKITEALK